MKVIKVIEQLQHYVNEYGKDVEVDFKMVAPERICNDDTMDIVIEEEEIEEAHKEVSSHHLSSVVWNQLSSLCSRFQEENHWSIQRFVLLNLDTCKED